MPVFELGIVLGIVIRDRFSLSLGIGLGIDFRFFECALEIGNSTKNASKRRFWAFSRGKIDMFLRLTHYYIRKDICERQCFNGVFMRFFHKKCVRAWMVWCV